MQPASTTFQQQADHNTANSRKVANVNNKSTLNDVYIEAIWQLICYCQQNHWAASVQADEADTAFRIESHLDTGKNLDRSKQTASHRALRASSTKKSPETAVVIKPIVTQTTQVPLHVAPDVNQNHRRWHSSNIWLSRHKMQALLRVFRLECFQLSQILAICVMPQSLCFGMRDPSKSPLYTTYDHLLGKYA